MLPQPETSTLRILHGLRHIGVAAQPDLSGGAEVGAPVAIGDHRIVRVAG